MKNVVIWTDGACSCNPGPGGWASILIYKSSQKEISGYNPETTNNQMELTAVIEGLSLLKEPCKVQIFTDSAYVCNAFTQGWVENWQNNNYKNAKKKEIENIELWKKLITLSHYHQIELNKVKGHAESVLNNRCDELARLQIEKNNKK